MDLRRLEYRRLQLIYSCDPSLEYGYPLLGDHTRGDAPDRIHLANDICVRKYRDNGVLRLFLCGWTFDDEHNLASIEPDCSDYSRVTRTWRCNDKHGTPSSTSLPALHVLNSIQLFKVFAIQSMGTGIQFTQDLKLAHYMKIPPRTTFWGTPLNPTSI